MLKAINIVKTFKGEPILNGVNLELQEGRITALIGASGCGKSVLVKILCSLLKPDSGNVLLKGEDIYQANFKKIRLLRNMYGVLFQNLALFDFLSVKENVAFPLFQSGSLPPDEIYRRVDERLHDISLQWAGNLMIHELSGGMQRRVALARATIARSSIVIYDDPTAGLDPVTSSKIFILIKKLHEIDKSTIFIVSHDIDRLKPVCDYYYLLEGGKIRFSGSLLDGELSQDDVVKEYFCKKGEV